MHRLTLATFAASALLVSTGAAQYAPGRNFSPNVKLVAHVPLPARPDQVAESREVLDVLRERYPL